MFIPIPLGAADHDHRPARATSILVVLNVLFFLLTFRAIGRMEKSGPELVELNELADWALRKEFAHRPLLEPLRKSHKSALDFLEADGSWRALLAGRESLADLEGYLTSARELLRQEPALGRLWLVPRHPTLLGLLAHMFIHGSFLHLFFNMLFLWTMGGFLERRLTARPYVTLYLLSGVAAALAQWATNPSSTIPMVGASGAIAGLMGAVACRFARARVRLLLVYALGFVPRFTIVAVPAGVFLGLWILEQLFFASLTSSALGGVAYGAHIGGFAFGGAAAVAAAAIARPPRAVTSSLTSLKAPPRPTPRRPAGGRARPEDGRG